MADTMMSPADFAAMAKDNDGFGGNGSWWIVLFLIFAMMGGGSFFGNRQGEFGQYATAASQNEILLGQQFQTLGQAVNAVGDGLCSSTYALNNAITGEGRAIQSQLAECCCSNNESTAQVRYDMANFAAQINATSGANTQKILDALCADRMAEMQSKINQLELANAVAGVVRYPMASTYSSGNNPFCGCGYNY